MSQPTYSSSYPQHDHAGTAPAIRQTPAPRAQCIMPPMKRLPALGMAALIAALAATALLPAADRTLARWRADRVLATIPLQTGAALVVGPVALPAERPLASWSTIGGCGAGGGSASAPGGGIRWIGRNVTGGLIDAQALTTLTYASGNQFTTVAARIAASPTFRWGVALDVPVLYKVGDVTLLGITRTAKISGFGDLSLEVSYKLGAIATHQLMLVASAPTGSSDAVRKGVVLPQHLQLGAGVPGLTAQYQHTQDHDWGLVLLGGTVSYAGWENAIGDFRSPSATAFAHLGYLLGRWVPSAGLTLFGKPWHDRERGARRAFSDPVFMLVPSVGLEWSRDWIAVLPAATVGLSPAGFESVSLGIGVSSSLF
jgi:hypothetical protein